MFLETANQINIPVTVVDADNSLSRGHFSNNFGMAGAREAKCNCGTDFFLSLSQEPLVCCLCTNQNQPLFWYKSWSMMVRNHSPRKWKDISKIQPGIFIGFLCFGFLVPQTSSCGNLTWRPQHHNPSMSMGIVLGSQKGSVFCIKPCQHHMGPTSSASAPQGVHWHEELAQLDTKLESVNTTENIPLH